MHPVLRAFLTQQITRSPYVSQDAYGLPSYGPPETLACRIEPVSLVIQTATGAQLTVDSRIYLDGTVSMTERDKLVLADGQEVHIERLEAYPELDGSRSYWAVYV